MKRITRQDNDVSILTFVVPYAWNGVDTPSLEYKSNISDTWVLKTTVVDSSECCGFVLKLQLDTSDIESGSFFIKAIVDGTNTAIEEYVLQDKETEVVSNYNGVKVIE